MLVIRIVYSKKLKRTKVKDLDTWLDGRTPSHQLEEFELKIHIHELISNKQFVQKETISASKSC